MDENPWFFDTSTHRYITRGQYSIIHTSYVIENTYELLKVFEYRMVGRASKELINQMAMIVPRIIQRDTFGLSG